MRNNHLKFEKSKEIKFRLGELFCGPGGLALGAINARLAQDGITYKIEHAWANDYHEDSCKTYRRNIANNQPNTVICQDVRKLNIEKLPPIDAFAYGFPCNDFSIVGEQKGFHGEFGPLYTYGVKILDFFRPKFFVAENVGGLRSANEGKAFQKILHDLAYAGNGYALTPHLYKFEDYGVPQTRHRVIIVGIDKTLQLTYRVPSPTTRNNPTTSKEAIENPPISPNTPNNELTAQSRIVIDRLKYTKPGENAWTAKLPKRLKLNVKGAHLSQIYKRLDPEKPAYTITGSGGGGTHGYHWKFDRALTNRERARLQTFPDNFIFEGSKESVRKQIGMAVSPKISEVIFSSILKTMAGLDYPSVQANLVAEPDLFDKNSFSQEILKEYEYADSH
jgi:DNA (cytosine-5)-methyltransferase 1